MSSLINKNFVIIIYLCLGWCLCSAATYNWTNGQGTQEWHDPNNWDPTEIPEWNDRANHYIDVDGPIIDDQVCVYEYFPNNWTTDNSTTLVTIDGDFRPGYLIVGFSALGQLDNYGVITVARNDINCNPDGSGNGNMDVGGHGGGQGIVNNYGDISIRNRLYIARDDAGDGAVSGTLNIYDGTVHCNGPFFIGVNGVVNIAGGTLLYHPTSVGVDYAYSAIADGRIIGYDGDPRASFNVSFDNDLWRVVVTATQPDPNRSARPYPADNKDGIVRFANLSWAPSIAAEFHDVYFGTDPNDVSDADNTDTTGIYLGRFTAETIEVDPGFLDAETTYYWRVDEVVTDDQSETVYGGDVWTFTTAPGFLVDDFENIPVLYDLNINISDPNLWVDPPDPDAVGKWSPDKTGSDPNFVIESSNEVALDSTSLAVIFNTEESPFAGIATLDFTKAIDMSIEGTEVLALSIHGSKGTTETPFSIMLEDETGAKSSFLATDGDTSIMAEEEWQQWHTWFFALSDLTGIDITKVTKMSIRLGDAASATGAGTIYLDNIYLAGSVCKAPQLGDLTGDCVVDLVDFAVLASDWLESGYTVTSSQPGTPIVHYAFNEGSGKKATDSAGNFDGTVTKFFPNFWDSTGGFDGSACIEFDGTFGVEVPEGAFADISNEVTVSIWVNGSDTQPQQDGQIFFFVDQDPGGPWLRANAPNAGGSVYFHAAVNGSGNTQAAGWLPKDGTAWKNQWNHYAFVKDASAGTLKIYHNGILVSQATEAPDTLEGIYTGGDLLYVGSANGSTYGSYQGKLDGFRLYNYALSQEEIVNLAGKSTVIQPVDSDADFDSNNAIGLGDLQIMLENWLTVNLFPEL